MLRFATLTVVALLACACSKSKSPSAPDPVPTGLSPGDTVVSLAFSGQTRTYALHVPASYTGTSAVPLVVDLHGNGLTSDSQASISGFRAKADQAGFIAAWPQGTGASWNAYKCCGSAHASNVDDVGYIRAVVTDLRGKGRIDAARMYVTGLSNGGLMTHRLACEAADVFAAAAPVSAPLNQASCPTGQPSRPITVVHMQGIFDVVTPYLGSSVFQSATASFTTWQTIDQCSGSPTVQRFANGDRCDTATTCASGARPALCSLSGGHILYSDQTTLNIADYVWDAIGAITKP